MATHPDLAAEQAYVDHAYDCLEEARRRALSLRRLGSVGPGGTHQARYESEIAEDAMRARLASLALPDDAALVFGRIDRADEDERFYIGRVAVADSGSDPVVVDWRAPVAEPFYRATGRAPMGLARRRHFASRGQTLLDIEDEVLGDGAAATASDEPVGRGALMAALERSRTGHLGDVVATIQAEQDEVIRDELGGLLVVQGGPGTGKTVVALHRAAYLLYTHRFPLEGQGVLVLGPNRVYLRYVERVLPSLGEAGVELGVLADLVPEPVGDGPEPRRAARVKGDRRMVAVVGRAVRDRQRRLRRDLVVGLGLQSLRCTVADSERIVASARRRSRHHNAGRRLVEQGLFETLAASARTPVEEGEVRERLRRTDEVRAALEWMWPMLTPAQLLHDLFGSAALLRSAAGRRLSADEQAALQRPRDGRAEDVRWTAGDVPLLDEARSLLGPLPRRDEDEPRTYGHIVVDEAQDLTPMQLRLVARRSLNGSMTVVGDMAQATGALAPSGWDEVVAALTERRASRREPRVRELSIGYRTPASVLTLANKVLAVAAPDLTPPRSVREGDAAPSVVPVATTGDLATRVAELAAAERSAVGEGNVAVVATDQLVEELADALTEAGVPFGEARRTGLEAALTLVPVRLAKGLELDAVVVVEPARIVAEEPQGLRSLYVALTRATRRLTVVHAEPLPAALVDG
ncbi:MAG TPA: ATP-binding domain-containing protein [Acidimicrobiales bacterium]|jgi:DNA helicase IV|nr:ATP-binding domain-containing protein [Acidimicrobiales bacterium]